MINWCSVSKQHLILYLDEEENNHACSVDIISYFIITRQDKCERSVSKNITHKKRKKKRNAFFKKITRKKVDLKLAQNVRSPAPITCTSLQQPNIYLAVSQSRDSGRDLAARLQRVATIVVTAVDLYEQ